MRVLRINWQPRAPPSRVFSINRTNSGYTTAPDFKRSPRLRRGGRLRKKPEKLAYGKRSNTYLSKGSSKRMSERARRIGRERKSPTLSRPNGSLMAVVTDCQWRDWKRFGGEGGRAGRGWPFAFLAGKATYQGEATNGGLCTAL